MRLDNITLCKCLECGALFDEEDAVRQEEYMGEFWGAPAYETWYYSPCCHAEYEEYEPDTTLLYKCEDCGKIWEYDELEKTVEHGFGYEKEVDIGCPDCYGDVVLYDYE